MTDDLISRQAAIDALRYAQHRFTVADEAGGMGTVKWSEDVIYFAAAERVLSELPSAQPERIRGRWILAKEQRREDIENGNYMYNCSNCDCGDLHSRAVNVSYCWNCGADMRGERDD